jgi:hypothetical protein
MTASGTSLTTRDVRLESANWAKADIDQVGAKAASPWDEARQRALDAASDRLDFEGVFCTTAPTTVDGLRAVVEYALTDQSCFLKDCR